MAHRYVRAHCCFKNYTNLHRFSRRFRKVLAKRTRPKLWREELPQTVLKRSIFWTLQDHFHSVQITLVRTETHFTRRYTRIAGLKPAGASSKLSSGRFRGEGFRGFRECGGKRRGNVADVSAERSRSSSPHPSFKILQVQEVPCNEKRLYLRI